METLYERIKYLCDSKGVKPGKMCADTGVSKGLISDLKYGRKKTITIETAQKMAKYFDVPVDIITGDGDKEIFATNLGHHLFLHMFANPNKVAEKNGVSPELVCDWLTGETCPELEVLDKLADCLGVSREQLLYPCTEEKEASREPVWMDSEVYEAMVKFKKLSSVQKKAVVQIIDAFLMR